MTILALCIGWWIGLHTRTLYDCRDDLRNLLMNYWTTLRTAIRRRIDPYT